MSRRALLLDLDGTLVDTAPDLVASLNEVLLGQGRAAVAYERARARASDGAVGLLNLGFEIAADDPRMPLLRQRFLQAYAARISRESRVFAGFDEVFRVLSKLGWYWGVVTNKPQQLAETLLRDLRLLEQCDCLIGGDILPRRKPYPDTLLLAAERLDLLPRHCVYAGDALRDIEAGRAAGMRTVAARYGYLANASEADHWHADFAVDQPGELVALVQQLHGTDQPLC